MDEESTHRITNLLRAWSDGDQAAGEELAGLVYQELRRIAERQMRRERNNHTLDPSALVHEAFMKLHSYRRVQWQDRQHFYRAAAGQMRRFLINYAKSRNAARNVGDAQRVTLEDAMVAEKQMSFDELLVLDEALGRLAAEDQRCEWIVELKFYAGLTNQEVAEMLGLSEKTVQRDWTFARSWLQRELSTVESTV